MYHLFNFSMQFYKYLNGTLIYFKNKNCMHSYVKYIRFNLTGCGCPFAIFSLHVILISPCRQGVANICQTKGYFIVARHDKPDNSTVGRVLIRL